MKHNEQLTDSEDADSARPGSAVSTAFKRISSRWASLLSLQNAGADLDPPAGNAGNRGDATPPLPAGIPRQSVFSRTHHAATLQKGTRPGARDPGARGPPAEILPPYQEPLSVDMCDAAAANQSIFSRVADAPLSAVDPEESALLDTPRAPTPRKGERLRSSRMPGRSAHLQTRRGGSEGSMAGSNVVDASVVASTGGNLTFGVSALSNAANAERQTATALKTDVKTGQGGSFMLTNPPRRTFTSINWDHANEVAGEQGHVLGAGPGCSMESRPAKKSAPHPRHEAAAGKIEHTIDSTDARSLPGSRSGSATSRLIRVSARVTSLVADAGPGASPPPKNAHAPKPLPTGSAATGSPSRAKDGSDESDSDESISDASSGKTATRLSALWKASLAADAHGSLSSSEEEEYDFFNTTISPATFLYSRPGSATSSVTRVSARMAALLADTDPGTSSPSKDAADSKMQLPTCSPPQSPFLNTAHADPRAHGGSAVDSEGTKPAPDFAVNDALHDGEPPISNTSTANATVSDVDRGPDGEATGVRKGGAATPSQLDDQGGLRSRHRGQHNTQG